MPNVVYKYGLSRPTFNATAVDMQMRLAHRYRNTLVEIERGRRAALRAAEQKWAGIPEMLASGAAAEAAVLTAVDAIKKARAASRSRSELASDRAAVADARKRKRATLELLHVARQGLRADASFIAEVDRINALGADLRRNAREHCGCYWGSYLLVEAADMAARTTPLYDGIESNDPAFQRWCGDGRIGVQLQGGLDTRRVYGDDTRVQIDGAHRGRDGVINLEPWSRKSTAGERRRASRTRLRLRIGSTPTGKPVWAEWNMVMHRPLPEGGQIKWVTVSAAVDGAKSGCQASWDRWDVEFTVAVDVRRRRRPAAHDGTSAVGVDLGWRLMDDGGVRVATWHGTDGAEGEVRLPADAMGGYQKTTDLQSIRDTYFEVARETLVKWLTVEAEKGPASAAPGWLVKACATLAQWRSIPRLRNLVRRWTRERDGVAGADQAAFVSANAWERRDHHLWSWQHGHRHNVVATRNDLYRNVAADLARQYDVVVLEKFDLRPMLLKQTDEPLQEAPRRANQHTVAPGALRMALRNAFGGDEALMPAANTTRECHVCHVVEQFDAEHNLRNTCPNGHEWDQDDNAALNLIERWRAAREAAAARSDDNGNEIKEVKEGRWERARRLSAEKKARMATAREVAANGAE